MRVKSILGICGAVWILAAWAAPARAQSARCEGIQGFLDNQGWTYTRGEFLGECSFEATTPEGNTITIRPSKDGSSYTLEELRGGQPRSGNWSRQVEVTEVDCPGTEVHQAPIIAQIEQVNAIMSQFMGSTDGGATVPYEFTTPFTPGQLLEPIFSTFRRVNIGSTVSYDMSTDYGGTHKLVSGELTQPSVYTIQFKMQILPLSTRIVSAWSAAAGDCMAHGFMTWALEA